MHIQFSTAHGKIFPESSSKFKPVEAEYPGQLCHHDNSLPQFDIYHHGINIILIKCQAQKGKRKTIYLIFVSSISKR